ncbi:MAG: HlyD family secretion protein [Acidobacteria bacterium]|nr:MAG: HlyD family secretion protein [Acidobacteriota bacterium]
MNALTRLMTSGGAARVRVLAGAGVLALVLGTAGAYFYFSGRVSTDDAQVDAHIAPVAAKVGGNIAEILVADNQVVKAGQVLLRIDPRDYKAHLDQVCAQLAAAESQARGADAGVPLTSATTASVTTAASAQLAAAAADHERAVADFERASSSELALAKADVEARRATADRARADLERMAPLAEKNEISKQQFDAYVAAERVALSELTASEQKLANAGKHAESSRAQVQASQARVEAARAALAQATANRRQVDISHAQAGTASAAIEQARAAVTAAQLQVEYTTISAPIDGIVTKKTIQLGQIVQPGQSLLTIVPLSDVWVTANFKETQLADVRPSQRAEIRVDAYGRSFDGHVDSIAGATGAKLSLLPPENATGNFVKIVQRIPVKVALDHAPEGYTFRPGMNVDVTIFTK